MVSAIEPLLRAKLLMALAGLVVLGLGMLAMIVLGGRYARRIARTSLPPSRTHEDRWYAKRLVPDEPEQPSNDGDQSEPGRQADSEGSDSDGGDSDGGDSDGADSQGNGPDEPRPDGE